MDKIWQDILNFVNINGIKVITFVLTVIIGIILIKLINKWVKKVFVKKNIDNIVTNFVSSLLYIILVILLIVLLFDLLNISTTPFVTILGTVGLALALSLKDSLSNIASGMIIIATKPFKHEDYVSIGGLEGSVKKINFFNTELYTIDNKRIIMPNNKVAKSDIINYSSLENRRMDINFTTPFGISVEKVKTLFSDIFKSNDYILNDPCPDVKLISHNQSTLNFMVRLWTKNKDYWNVYYDIQEKMYNILKDSEIEIKQNRIDVNIINK